MSLAQGGDRTAYERLMTELGDAIEAYLRSRFGSIGLLEDCVQEALLAIHRARHTYDPRRDFRPWLFTIVKHRTIDVLRRNRGPRPEPAATQVPGHAARDASPGGHQDNLNAAIDGASVLGKLKPADRQALLLTKLAGYTMAEAGRCCGISEGAMKVRVHRALRAVRKLLEHEGLPT